jgi:hypothetical protein
MELQDVCQAFAAPQTAHCRRRTRFAGSIYNALNRDLRASALERSNAAAIGNLGEYRALTPAPLPARDGLMRAIALRRWAVNLDCILRDVSCSCGFAESESFPQEVL